MDYQKLLYAAQLREIAIELMNGDSQNVPLQERSAFIEKQDPKEYVKRAHRQVLTTLSFLDDQEQAQP